ncbi:SURF1 family protein [Vibrio mexicanus]|uniref:SURF1 family protein n=1 Tax=Vibrio mexicanus TaxID=1004326 RepID=UPI000B0DC60D|nr:SURF1 family protein [Vibrio mexicanus]
MTKSSNRTSAILNSNVMQSSQYPFVRSGRFWLGLTLTVGLFCLLVKLGFWQMSRGEEKQLFEEQLLKQQSVIFEGMDALLESFSSRGIDVSQNNALSPITGTRIEMDVVPIAGQYLLLDNQTYQGKVGYLAYQLVKSQGHYVLLERGFVNAKSSRDVLPMVDWLVDPIRLVGRVYQKGSNPLSQELNLELTSPNRVQNLNLPELGDVWGVELLNFVVQPQLEGWPYPQPWQPVPLSSQKHFGYAVQWFSMAAALFVLSGYVLFRLVKQSRREGDNK